MFTSVGMQYANGSNQHKWHLQPSFQGFFFSHDNTVVFVRHLLHLFHSLHPASTCTSQLPVAHFNLFPAITYVSRKTQPPSHQELICQEQDRSVSLLLLLIAALRQLLKWEQEIRRVGGMRYHKLNWDLICDGISKHPVWRFAGNTLGGMSSPSGQAIALRLCEQFLITSVWLTGNFDLSSRHKQATGVYTAATTWC